MIDDNIMNKIIPIPDEDELEADIRTELEEKGFLINNYNAGGIFYTILRICIWIHLELLTLARTIVNNCFIKHVSGDWLEIKAADYGKARKEATKTQGYITITRSNYEGSVTITKGHMFKTLPDVNGTELKYYCLNDTIIESGEKTGRVLVEAENSGTYYNVSEGKIIISMIYIDGVESITNEAGWLFSEGSDIEDLESLRSRCAASYSELSGRTIEEKLKNVAAGVPGVVSVRIDAQHPRGQATVDVIITGSSGVATEELIKKVDDEISYLKGNYEDFLVKSADIYKQDFELIIYISEDSNTEGIAEQAESIITNMLKITDRDLNILYLDSIITELKNNITDYKKTKFINPSEDIECSIDQVIVCGDFNVTVENVRGG